MGRRPFVGLDIDKVTPIQQLLYYNIRNILRQGYKSRDCLNMSEIQFENPSAVFYCWCTRIFICIMKMCYVKSWLFTTMYHSD